MNDKIKDPKCVNHKVKISSHNYSKENFLATFTPQKQLTPEQIFWFQDLIKMKTEALKEQTTTSRPIKAKHDENERKKLLIVNDNLIAECLSKEVFSVATNSELNVTRFTEMHVAHTIVEARVNDNLIAECLSKEVFSVATNSELNVAKFTKMHVANTIVETRCLELEAELSNLHSFGNNPPTLDKDTLNFDSVFVIGKMQACLQGKDNVIRKLQKQISHLQETHSEADCTLDFRALDSQITQLTAKVTALQAQNDLFRAENDKIKQHYKELYDSIKITCAKHIEHVTALTTENVNLKTQILNTMKSVSKDHVKPKVLTLGKYVVD
nr:hypothetical protein [Tanacetum cinerariifolium]